MISNVKELDFKILNWIQKKMRCSFLDEVMPILTSLGDGGLIWVVVAGLFLTVGKYRAGGMAIFVVLTICYLTGNLMVKNLAGRNRPCDLVEDFPLLIPRPRDYSFPSGHTLASFAVAVVIFGVNEAWGLVAFCLAGLIGFSRLYLYVHFPSDVLAGVVMGVLIGSLPVAHWLS